MIWIVLSILFIIYGISIGYKNTGTNFYLIWFVFACGCIIMYFMNVYQLWEKIPSILLWIFFIGLVIGCSILLILVGCIHSQFLKKGEPNLDYIIVLGAQWKKSGPSKALRFRLESAYSYLLENPQTICIVSGGQGWNEPCSEASGMASYLKNKGIQNTILLEDQSTNTLENIQMSMKLMKSSSVGIVTNNFHVYRSVSIAKKQGLVHAQGIAAPSHRWYQPNNVLREVFGIIKDKLVHNM